MYFNYFETVSTYKKMLNKISSWTLAVGLLLTWLVTCHVDWVADLLAKASVDVSMIGVKIPLGLALPAVAVTVIFTVFKMHDRLSDVFLIRQRFDVLRILFPLALGSGAKVAVSRSSIDAIGKRRKDLMYKVFYPYLRPGDKPSQIDPHYVTMALNQWSWYWIVLEADALAVIAALFLFFNNAPTPAFWLMLAVLASIWALQGILAGCSHYAEQEVEWILSEPERATAIVEEFSAL